MPALAPKLPAAPTGAPDAAARDKAVRTAKAKLAREQKVQAAQAEEDAARARADEARARAAAAVVATPPVSPAAVVAPVVEPALPKTAQQLCAGRNAIARSVCESFQCARLDHADETLCRDIRAAEERRRQ